MRDWMDWTAGLVQSTVMTLAPALMPMGNHHQSRGSAVDSAQAAARIQAARLASEGCFLSAFYWQRFRP